MRTGKFKLIASLLLVALAVSVGHEAKAVLTGDTVLRERVYEGPSAGNRRQTDLLDGATLPITYTAANWADVGDPIQVNGAGVLGVWARVVTNNTENIRFRFLHKLSS